MSRSTSDQLMPPPDAIAVGSLNPSKHVMLDRRFILDNVAQVQQNCEFRGVKANVARFAQLETERRELQQEIEELSRQANTVSKSIGKAKDEAEREARKEEGRRLRAEKEHHQADIDRIAAEANAIYNNIPNLTHAETPHGGEEASRELRRGAIEVAPMSFPVLDHVELAEQHQLVDFEGGSRIAGHGFYFLQNEA
ncbi:MAG: hypothetical protein ACR2NU_08485, partial [Aeoliella sp.]